MQQSRTVHTVPEAEKPESRHLPLVDLLIDRRSYAPRARRRRRATRCARERTQDNVAIDWRSSGHDVRLGRLQPASRTSSAPTQPNGPRRSCATSIATATTYAVRMSRGVSGRGVQSRASSRLIEANSSASMGLTDHHAIDTPGISPRAGNMTKSSRCVFVSGRLGDHLACQINCPILVVRAPS